MSGRGVTAVVAAVLGIVTAGAALPATAAAPPPTSGTVGGFAYGEPQASTVGAAGCGTNTDGEPSLHVSRGGLVGLGSERGIGSGSDYWRAPQLGAPRSAPTGSTSPA